MKLITFTLFLLSCFLFGKDRIEKPNILFAIADDWSFGHASAYGCTWIKTPAFDRLAREGILFNRAYTPNAKCAPSHYTDWKKFLAIRRGGQPSEYLPR